jgi:hypothetical protein
MSAPDRVYAWSAIPLPMPAAYPRVRLVGYPFADASRIPGGLPGFLDTFTLGGLCFFASLALLAVIVQASSDSKQRLEHLKPT